MSKCTAAPNGNHDWVYESSKEVKNGIQFTERCYYCNQTTTYTQSGL